MNEEHRDSNSADRSASTEEFEWSANAEIFSVTIYSFDSNLYSTKCFLLFKDVFSVKFSLDDERRLTTCGTGHIRFWKLAATFTGLKLQGLIGKFGKAELSDIAAFVECPDGKVVSGTESGSL